MRRSKLFFWVALAGGMAFPAALTLSAADRYGQEGFNSRQEYRQDYRQDYRSQPEYNQRQDLRQDHRELNYDRARAERLRARIAREEWQLNEELLHGRRRAAERTARELERDRWALRAVMHELYRDRVEIGRDYATWRYR